MIALCACTIVVPVSSPSAGEPTVTHWLLRPLSRNTPYICDVADDGTGDVAANALAKLLCCDRALELGALGERGREADGAVVGVGAVRVRGAGRGEGDPGLAGLGHHLARIYISRVSRKLAKFEKSPSSQRHLKANSIPKTKEFQS